MERNMYGGERSALNFVELFLRHSSSFLDIHKLINSAMDHDISLGWWIMSLLYSTEQIFSVGTSTLKRRPQSDYHYRNKKNLIDPIVENHILRIYYFHTVPIHWLDHLLGVRLCAFTDIEDFHVYRLSNHQTLDKLKKRIIEYVTFLTSNQHERTLERTKSILKKLEMLQEHLPANL